MIDYLHYIGGSDLLGIQGSRVNVGEILRRRGTVCKEEYWKEENLAIPKGRTGVWRWKKSFVLISS